MPVLGTAGSTSTASGTFKRGVFIPGDWGQVWRAARNASGSSACEVVAFGDSTTYGSGPSPTYSWLQRVRDRSLAAGYGDGGKGIFGAGETSMGYDNPVSEVNGLVSVSPGGAWNYLIGGADDPLGGQFWSSNTAAEVLTLQGRGTKAKVWYANRASAGQFGVTVNGGSEQIVNANQSGASTAGWLQLTGLPSGQVNTVAIRNVGGLPIAAPTLNSASGSASGGTLAAGTYFYVATTYNGSSAESVISGEKSVTVSGSTSSVTLTMLTAPLAAGATTRIYRSTVSGSGYQLVGTVGSNSSGSYTYTDTGTAGGAAPVQNGGLNSATMTASIGADFYNPAGIVWHKHATSGLTMTSFFDVSTNAKDHRYQAALGLVQSTTTGYPFGYGQAQDGTTGARRPVLAMLDLGFNDMTNFTDSRTGLDILDAGIHMFCQAAKQAGAEPLVISGNYNMNPQTLVYAGQVRRAIYSAAVANEAAWVDFLVPLGKPSQTGSNPHLTKAQYQTQADFLWDNVLSL